MSGAIMAFSLKFTKQLILLMIPHKKCKKWYFKLLTQLKQHGLVKEFCIEFERLKIMVPKVSQERFTFLFIEGYHKMYTHPKSCVKDTPSFFMKEDKYYHLGGWT